MESLLFLLTHWNTSSTPLTVASARIGKKVLVFSVLLRWGWVDIWCVCVGGGCHGLSIPAVDLSKPSGQSNRDKVSFPVS